MKKLIILFVGCLFMLFTSCTANDIAEINRNREANTARLQSEYAIVVNYLLPKRE